MADSGVLSNAAVSNAVDTGEVTERIVPDPSYGGMQISPGESDSFDVTLTNPGNATETISTSVYNQDDSQYPIDPSWVTITPSTATIEAGNSVTVNVAVAVPAGTSFGSYDCMLNIGDEQGNASSVSVVVDVWSNSNIQITPQYLYDWVDAGKEYNYEIQIKNAGSSEVAISPEVEDTTDVSSPGTNPGLSKEDLTVTGPSSILPGESAAVNLKVVVPEGATGDFDGSIKMNIDDPTVYPDSDKVTVNFHIPVIPENPYDIPFKVNTNGIATIELKSDRQNFYSVDEYANPSFAVKIFDPQGNEVSPVLTGNLYGGSVTIGSSLYELAPIVKNRSSEYQESEQQYVDTYDVPVTPGTWRLSVMPYATESFDYTINIKPSQ